MGATEEVIETVLKVIADRAKVKGSECIRTKEHFFAPIDLGVDRMGVGYKSTPVLLG